MAARYRSCPWTSPDEFVTPAIQAPPDDSERVADSGSLRETLSRIQRQFDVVGRVSQLGELTSGDVESAARHIARLAAAASGCARVNAWTFNDAETELTCIASYDSARDEFSSGVVLHEPDFRSEFQFLKTARYVDADDPLTDPRTAGYVESYVRPLGITSMLDAVIRTAGHTLGVLCFEHVGRPHHWAQDEIAFACQLADKLGVALTTRRRLRSEEQTRQSEAALAEAQAIAHVGSWNFELATARLTWSAETYRIMGVDPAAFEPSYAALMARVHPDDRADVDAQYRRSVATPGDSAFAFDHRVIVDDGTVKYVHERGHTVYDASGAPVMSVGTVQDITDRKHAEERLQFANTLLTTEMETSPDGVLVVDASGHVLSANRRFAEIWRVPVEQLTGTDDAPLLASVAACMRDADAFVARVRYFYAHPDEAGEDELETRDGRCIERHTTALRTPSGQHLGRVWFFRDITARKQAEAQMRHTARHDGLTDLANRAAFVEEVNHAIVRARRTPARFAVLSLDLDHFKDVNDTLGHPVGDELLQQVARRLRDRVRAADVVARFGGDEFAVVASGIEAPVDAAALASSLVKTLAEPFWIAGNEIRTGASVGLAVYGPETGDAETLLAHADVALYRAKTEERGGYRFFTDAMDIDVRRRVALRTELRRAIDEEQLFLVYQPQILMATGRVTGLEALVRWRHPQHGVLLPGMFIPIAEDSGLIIALSRWVLREACRQAQAWIADGLSVPSLAVNISPAQFKLALELEGDLAATLDATGLDARVLELELTERVLMSASREHTDLLVRLRRAGLRVAIDDFGTGYSSLDYLRRFPVDRIKIAQEFVSHILDVGGSSAIIRATIGLARELGIAVIAEGVRSREEMQLLSRWGCAEAQGYYFSPPLEPDAIVPWIREGRVPPRTASPV
jgi:diguanylate cyclase (GGDEF)-like protein/PAS domain S-box-containing protein